MEILELQIQELTKHNELLENYFRNTIIPHLFIDRELRVRKFTPPAMKQFSLSYDDLGKHIEEIKDNFRFPSIIDNIEQVIESNTVLEKEIQTTDFRWYQMNIIPYVLSDNTTNGVIITFVEITSRIKDLKEQEKLIKDHEILLDTISHDIKNPLGNLVLAFGMFKKVSPSDEKKFNSLLKIVEYSLTQMQRLIKDLTLVRQKEHKYETEEELLSFENIFEDVRLILNEYIIAEDARIVTDINVSEITFSRRKLRTIVYNLINNAIKFKSPDRKSHIVVSTYNENDCIIISVKDNGIGIAEKQLDEIFSKYNRVNNNTEGSGIGLYLVKQIIDSVGGEIQVKSQLNIGTEFILNLKKNICA